MNISATSPDSSEAFGVPTDLALRLRLNDGTGNAAVDSSGRDLSGTLVNSPTWKSTGKIGGSLAFDGADDHVTLPAGVVEDLNEITISAWVKLSSIATWARLFDFGNGTGSYMFLSPRGGSNVVRFAITTGGSTMEQQINGAAALPTGVWTHVAVTLNGSVGTLYVNGQQVGRNDAMTLDPSALGVTTQSYLGRSQFADPYLAGEIDEFRIYSRALTASEVARLTDIVPPNVAVNFQYQVNQSLVMAFSEDVLSSLDASDLVVTNIETGAVLPASNFSLTSTGGVGTPTVATLTRNPGAGPLPNGHYRLSISGISDFALNDLTSVSYSFFTLAGDANRDGVVGFDDLLTVARNYGGSGKTFSEGNFDYDPAGNVGFSDLLILARNYGLSSAFVLALDVPVASASPSRSRPGARRAVGPSILE